MLVTEMILHLPYSLLQRLPSIEVIHQFLQGRSENALDGKRNRTTSNEFVLIMGKKIIWTDAKIFYCLYPLCSIDLNADAWNKGINSKLLVFLFPHSLGSGISFWTGLSLWRITESLQEQKRGNLHPNSVLQHLSKMLVMQFKQQLKDPQKKGERGDNFQHLTEGKQVHCKNLH